MLCAEVPVIADAVLCQRGGIMKRYRVTIAAVLIECEWKRFVLQLLVFYLGSSSMLHCWWVW